MRKSASPTPTPIRRAMRDIGNNIQAWRKLRGLTQSQLADRAAVARTTVIRLEHDNGNVSLENTLRVLNALGILENVPRAVDPYETDLGRLRADEQLPVRVRPRSFGADDD